MYGEVPLVETPLNITVMRFTVAGKLVKLMLVPLVDATAVPLVIPVDAGAALVQAVPLLVSTLPLVLGATATAATPPTVAVPATVKLLPTATLPLASLTMLFTALEGWTTLMDLRVLMVASY